MSWTQPLSYLSVLSLLEILQIGKQVAQAAPSAPQQAKKSEAAPVKSGDTPGKSTYEEAFERERKSCRMKTLGSKPILYMNCLDEARRRLKNPPKPSPAKSPLEKELASCEMRGKPVQVWQCKREAPEKIERQRKAAAAEAQRLSKLTPGQRAEERLQRALNSCSMHSKPIQIMQCRQEAKEKHGSR